MIICCIDNFSYKFIPFKNISLLTMANHTVAAGHVSLLGHVRSKGYCKKMEDFEKEQGLLRLLSQDVVVTITRNVHSRYQIIVQIQDIATVLLD